MTNFLSNFKHEYPESSAKQIELYRKFKASMDWLAENTEFKHGLYWGSFLPKEKDPYKYTTTRRRFRKKKT